MGEDPIRVRPSASEAWPQLNLLPQRPPYVDEFGVGLVGLGRIVVNRHLPAYERFGVSVVGGADPSSRARELAREAFDLRTYGHVDDLLADPRVAIVDVAIPNTVPERRDIVHAAIDAGKHILLQKPAAHELDVAAEYLRRAHAAGVKIAVNQQARWGSVYLAARQLIASGELGEIYLVTNEIRMNQDSDYDCPWWEALQRPLFLEYTIHTFDLLRFWFDADPDWIFATTSRRPGQRYAGDMIASAILAFGDARATVIDDDASFSEDQLSRFRIEGTDGLVNGTVGISQQGAGSLSIIRRGSNEIHHPRIEGSWSSEAFAAVMFELMNAVSESREPATGLADNLHTLAVVVAAERSAATNSVVRPGEVLRGVGIGDSTSCH